MKPQAAMAVLALALATSAGCQDTRELTIDFEAGELAEWQITGEVAVAEAQGHDSLRCLQVAPKASAALPVAPENGFGTVEMWVHDAGYKREGDAAKDYAFGPVWGLTNAGDQRLVMGQVWAPYLAGNDSYGWISTAENDWGSRRYARARRGEGWVRWQFVVNNETDLVVHFGESGTATGFDVMAARYHEGFSGIFLRGAQDTDEPLLVDDIKVSWQATPLFPHTIPLPGEKWPAPEREPLPLRAEVAAEHPRLFFTADDIPAIRARCDTTHRKFFDAQLEMGNSYVGLMPPENEADCSDDQTMQQWAWWRLSTLAFTYVVTGEPRYAEKARDWMLIFCSYEHWGRGGDRDQSMGAANMITGVSCAYDWCYDVLGDEERATIRDKLADQVARMYHLGFADPQTEGYWKGDEQNNHMHHRLCGLLLGALVTHGETPESEAYASYAAERCRAVYEALPPDGSNHEGPSYQAFGHSYVARCFDALRHTTGIDLFDHDFVRNAPYFRAHNLTPGFQQTFNWSDSGAGTYYFNHYLFRLASAAEDADTNALLDAAYDAAPGSYQYPPWCVLWFDASLEGGSMANIPRWRYFPDIEIATYRSDWTDPSALAALFKCGPYGGHLLNQLSEARGGGWVNVAHDHPDANHFLLYRFGQFWATDDSYPKQSKAARNHNVILVDGQGQAHRGGGWSQPISNQGSMGRIEQYCGAPGFMAARGDASNYFNQLIEAKRWFVVVDDSYVVILDTLTGAELHTYQWLYHAAGEWTKTSDKAFEIMQEDHKLRIDLLLPEGVRAATEKDELEGKERGMVLTAENAEPVPSVQFLAVLSFDGEVSSTEAETLDNGVALTVRRGGITHELLFSAADDTLEYGGNELDGQLGLVSHEQGGAVRSCTVVGGTHIKLQDGTVVGLSKPGCLRWIPGDKTVWVQKQVGEADSQALLRIGEKELPVDLKAEASPYSPG